MNHKTSSLHLSSLHPYFYIFIYFAQSSIIIIDDICLLIVIPKIIKKNDNPLFAISLYIQWIIVFTTICRNWMISVQEIIEKQKLKQKIWMLQAKQDEGESDEPTVDEPDEYKCPICYEQFDSQDKKPIVLFPCGHSICSECLKHYERSTNSRKCCMCNSSYKSTAVNYALLNAMGQASSAQSKQSFDFKKDLSMALKRYELLMMQRKELESKSSKLQNEIRTKQIVFDRICDELTFLKQQYEKEKESLDKLKNEDNVYKKEINNIKEIMDPLETEIQKLRLLAQAQSNND